MPVLERWQRRFWPNDPTRRYYGRSETQVSPPPQLRAGLPAMWFAIDTCV